MNAIHNLIFVLGLFVAVVAALRSTWSPCGTSMLSTITPLSERLRGHSYAITASWFTLGATAGGAMLGAIGAALASFIHLFHFGQTSLLVIATLAALVAGAVDSGLIGSGPPFVRRQVNERWLDEYRPWFYGAGFGWQIGVGLATYIMTAAVGLTVLFGALTGSAWRAVVVGSVFGFCRGLAVFASRRLRHPDDLREFHRRFESKRGPVVKLVIGVQLGVALLSFAFLAAALGFFPSVASLAVLASVAGVIQRLQGKRRQAPAAP